MSEKKIQAYKVEAVQELTKQFSTVKDYIFTNYRGLTVEQISALRKELRKENAEYHVIKNNYAKIVFREMKASGVDDYLFGPTAIALAKGDSSPVAKILMEFSKENQALEVKGGYIAGTAFNGKQIDAYSKLPSRNDLLAMLMSTMRAPVQNMVYVLNGVTTKLVRTLQAVADQKAGK